ncbi:MAG: VanZ family protein [Candidatus Auribacterota bacterium]|nr:VanZ family protein [Candidatus Auribacterota bacterium]
MSDKRNMGESRMGFLDRSHKVLMWTVAVLILAYAPIARPIQKYLRELFTSILGTEGMMIFVLSLFLIGSIVFVCVSRFWRLPLPRIITLIILLASGVIYSFFLRLPEERIHLVEFGLLGILACTSFRGRRSDNWIWIWKPLLFIFLVGSADEIFQWFLPDRVFDLRDILFNTLGGIWGIWLYMGITWTIRE